MEDRSRLRQLLLAQSYQKRKVILASGRESDFYFDGKQTSLHPEGATLLGRLFWEKIQKHFPSVEAVGGPTLGADPLVTAVSLAAFQKGSFIPAFIIRKEPKKHGTQQWVEGEKNLHPGMKVVLLEDVVTTGESVIKAAERAALHQLVVLGVAVIVDREEGGKENLESKGFPMISLFTKTDLLV